MHNPHTTVRYQLPWTFSTFDYRTLCGLLREQGSDAEFDIAKVEGRTGDIVHTDRGDLTAPLIVDGLGWRRILGRGENVQPPDALLSRGLEVHPGGGGPDLEIWIDRGVRAGRLRLVVPGRRRGARGRRLVRPALPREGADRAAGRGPLARPGEIPGQLDPPQAAPRDRRRHLHGRRLGRALPAADGRGDPHRACTSASRAGASCAQSSRAVRRASRRWRATTASRASHRVPVRLDAARAETDPARLAARAGARLARHDRPALRRLVVRPLPEHRPPGLRARRPARRALRRWRQRALSRSPSAA